MADAGMSARSKAGAKSFDFSAIPPLGESVLPDCLAPAELKTELTK